MNRYTSTRKASIISIISNIFLLLIKSAIGFASGSQAMIADAANSATDIFASIMTFIGNKIASEPADENHNFGHGKAEYVFSMFISIAMILGALALLLHSVTAFINNSKLEFSWFLVITCIVTIIIKFLLYSYTNKLYKKYNNILIKVSMIDHRNDCIITIFTLISVLLSLKNIYWFDIIVGIGISTWICFIGIKLLIESYNTLIDTSIDKKTKNTILELINTYEDIEKISDFYSTPSGFKYIIVITIYVDGNMSTFDSHKLADNLENKIKKLNSVQKAIVHVNPSEYK